MTAFKSLTTPGPFALHVEPLSTAFYIASITTTRRIAIPITFQRVSAAPWHDEKLPPVELWESVTTEQERADIRLLCKSAELYEIVREFAYGNPDVVALVEKSRDICDKIEGRKK